ncbi:MAG: hypothetical protein ACO38W_13850, partial [Phycisphaerales bacterium]
PIEETSWEEVEVKEAKAEVVAYEDLTAQQQAMADQMMTQLSQAPVEMLPQLLEQLEGAVNMAPADQKPLIFYAIGKIKEKMGQ